MRVTDQLLEIRDPAHIPKQPHITFGGGPIGDGGVLSQIGKGAFVLRFADPDQAGQIRGPLQTLSQRREGAEIQNRVSPANLSQPVKFMGFDPLNNLRLDFPGITRGPEGAVTHVPAGTAGDLGQFLRPQTAGVMAVELAQRRKSDVIDVHIEAHADGVGRHEIVHVAILE